MSPIMTDSRLSDTSVFSGHQGVAPPQDTAQRPPSTAMTSMMR